jgi:hypothetical protein
MKVPTLFLIQRCQRQIGYFAYVSIFFVADFFLESAQPLRVELLRYARDTSIFRVLVYPIFFGCVNGVVGYPASLSRADPSCKRRDRSVCKLVTPYRLSDDIIVFCHAHVSILKLCRTFSAPYHLKGPMPRKYEPRIDKLVLTLPDSLE